MVDVWGLPYLALCRPLSVNNLSFLMSCDWAQCSSVDTSHKSNCRNRTMLSPWLYKART